MSTAYATPFNAENLDLLGEILTWNTYSSVTALTDIRHCLREADLPEEVAGDLNAHSAFTRAAKHLKKERSIDQVKVGEGRTTFQLTKKTIDAQHDRIDFDYETTVTLDNVSGIITCPNESIEHQAQALFDAAMIVRTNSDISRMIQRLFRDNADLFPINRQKGVAYFCPAEHIEFAAKVEKFIVSVGGELSRFPVPKGTKVGDKSVKEAVTNGFKAMIEEAREIKDSWDDTTRPSTVSRYIQRLREIDHKAHCYGEYFKSEQQGVLLELKDISEAVIERVTSLNIGKKK